ncbi:MAG: L-lactate permease, partial [Candidatus Gottesmanbacteria bacterium]|nr:L-lactate permease [Candidatus Gottesmanbacteria bacterium]
MITLPIFLSAFPLLVFTVILLFGKTSLLKASAISLALSTILAIFYWGIFPSALMISYGKGFFVALDIFFIILGAIFFLDLLEEIKVIKNISYYLEHFSRDYRLQIILLAWLFEAFIEGTAGFGTPVAIVAPLLVGLGLPPIRALVIALLGNSAAVVFGAVGTPIRVGFAGLDTASVPFISSLINCIGFIIPIFMLWIITTGRMHQKREFLSGLPFAIWAGIAFVVPSVVIALWSQEFPSVFGSVIGILLVLITTKLGLFVPKDQLSLQASGEKKLGRSMSAAKAFLPYGLLIVLLILGKVFLGTMGIPISLGFSHVFNLFNPGFAFIAASLLVALMWRSKKETIIPLVSKAFVGALNPFLIIISMSVLVQIMIYSGQNYSGLPAAITLVAKVFETSLLPFFVPFIGAFGSFITGSATISNIMFGSFFSTAAATLGNNVTVILSLAVVGASAGNMIALSDMLAGQAVLGLKNQERQILKGVFIPCLLLLII